MDTPDRAGPSMVGPSHVAVHRFVLSTADAHALVPAPGLDRILQSLLGNVHVGYRSGSRPADLRIDVRAGVDTAVGVGSHDLPQHTWQITDDTEGRRGSLYVVMFQVTPATVLVKGQRITIPAGHLLIASSGVPFTVVQEGPCRWQIIRVTTAGIQLPSDVVDQLLYQHYQISSFLRNIIVNVLPTSEMERSTESSTIDIIGFDRYLTGLVELVLRSIADTTCDLVPSVCRQQVERFIVRNLSDAELSVSAIASANAVSRRRLYQIFAGAGVGVAEFIRRARLEKALSLLGDPAYDTMAVGRIAREVGIRSPTHFSRLFRDATGMSPLEYRRAVREQRNASNTATCSRSQSERSWLSNPWPNTSR